MRLSRAPRLVRPGRRRCADLRQSSGVVVMEANQYFVRGVLQPNGRFVQLPGSFARQLAELVTVGHVRECPKNQIRTHKVKSPSRLVRVALLWYHRYRNG